MPPRKRNARTGPTITRSHPGGCTRTADGNLQPSSEQSDKVRSSLRAVREVVEAAEGKGKQRPLCFSDPFPLSERGKGSSKLLAASWFYAIRAQTSPRT